MWKRQVVGLTVTLHERTPPVLVQFDPNLWTSDVRVSASVKRETP